MAVIALDLGGTKLAAALFNDNGDILFKTTHSLDKKQGTEVGKLISQVANDLSNKVEDSSAIGICVPGIAHTKDREGLGAKYSPGWDDYPLLEELQRSG
jgi:glucokinase